MLPEFARRTVVLKRTKRDAWRRVWLRTQCRRTPSKPMAYLMRHLGSSNDPRTIECHPYSDLNGDAPTRVHQFQDKRRRNMKHILTVGALLAFAVSAPAQTE